MRPPMTRKHIFTFYCSATTHHQFECRRAQWNLVQFVLFRRARRFHPLSGLKVELIPSGAEHLAASRAGQQQKPDDIRHILVWVSAERIAEPDDLLRF